jgi:phosphate transport system protein
MAEIGREMMRTSLKAYLDWDAELAQKTIMHDAIINQLDEQVYHDLLAIMLQDPTTTNRATHLLWVSHNLERVGDRDKNICERVIFMVTGEVEKSKQERF